jgi:hypothetical protein
MRRREFITILGGATATWPLVARAQQAGKLPTVGVLVAGTPASHGKWVAAFVQRLRELGWIEGRSIAIEYRWAEGRTERFAEIAAEFVRLKVDVIFTSVTGAVIAAKQATSVTPIVFTLLTDRSSTAWSRAWRDRMHLIHCSARMLPAARSRSNSTGSMKPAPQAGGASKVIATSIFQTRDDMFSAERWKGRLGIAGSRPNDPATLPI